MSSRQFDRKVALIWDELRPVTRKMLAGAMKSGPSQPLSTTAPKFFYDATADWEVSRLLTALDEEAKVPANKKNKKRLNEIVKLADVCVRVLETQSASAEVFDLLAERALRDNDYDRLERLAENLADRYSAGEIAEIIRQTEYPQVRAIAYETLAMLPVDVIAPLLDDGLYFEIALYALEQKAFEFDSEEARELLDQMELQARFVPQS
ncbi:MAG: hypothetical protein KF881_02905 [Acidobacteria bacterium]|nr:hypothetical protein [Acidobacteriota bacterium]